MLFINRYLNLRLKNHLQKLPKKEIFKVGEGGGTQVSGIYRYNNLFKFGLDLSEYMSLIEYNYEYAKANKLNVNDNFFLENREYHFNKNDKPFEGKFHMDMIEESQKPCYTFIYYYNISPNIVGGELEFENGQKYKPQEYDVICFDGNTKHKVNKLYGEGIRGTLIMNVEKNELF